MDRIWKSCGLAAVALIQGCALTASPYSVEELAEAESRVTGVYFMDNNALAFACNHYTTERIDGCAQIVGERVELYIREGMTESVTRMQYRILLDRVRYRLFESGTPRGIRTHSYNNAARHVFGPREG